MPRTKEILCLSNLPWAERTTRRQMIMSRMRDVRIVYIDPPEKRASFSRKRPDTYKPYPHVTVYSSAGFLTPDSPLFRTDPVRGRTAYLRYLNSVLSKEEMNAPLLWLYSPHYVSFAEEIAHDGLVYDCADQFSRSSSGRKNDKANKRELALCRRADVVFAARRDLYQKLVGFKTKTYLLPNGIDYRPKSGTQLPDADAFPRPLIGFAGDLSDNADVGLLEAAAGHTEGTLLLVTTAEMRDRVDREAYLRLASIENVVPHIVDSQPAILDAVSSFDLFLAPYREGTDESDLRTRVFYACLAAGKPIVSTKHSALVGTFSDCVYAAEDRESFLEMMDRALEEKDPERNARQLAYADGCRWDARILEIRRLLAREGFLVD